MQKEMAIHSALVWEIPWVEKPGGPVCGVAKESNTAKATKQQILDDIILLLVSELQKGFFLKKKKKERKQIALFPLVSKSECFLRNLLWVFEEHLAHPSSHANMCQHTNPLTLPHQR